MVVLTKNLIGTVPNSAWGRLFSNTCRASFMPHSGKLHHIIGLYALVFITLMNSMIPFGFMPGNIFSGQPLMKLCPEHHSAVLHFAQESAQSQSLEDQSLVEKNSLHMSEHEHEHQHNTSNSTNECYWGGGFVTFFALVIVFFLSRLQSFKLLFFYRLLFIQAIIDKCFAIRAPPFRFVSVSI